MAWGSRERDRLYTRGDEMRASRDLRPLPLNEVLPLGSKPSLLIITMSEGQWDETLSAAYEQGWVLLELDENEQPVRAFKRAIPETSETPWSDS